MAESSSKKQMSAAEWAEACALWESGEFTLTQLSERFNVSPEHLSRRFKKEDKVKGATSHQITERVNESVQEEISESAKVFAKRVAETKEQSYLWATAVGQKQMQIIAQAQRDGKAMALIIEDAKALDKAMAVLDKVQKARWSALGLDKEDHVEESSLPELPLRDLTGAEMEEIRNRAELETMGVSDGLGGVLQSGNGDNLVTEGDLEEDSDLLVEGLDEEDGGD